MTEKRRANDIQIGGTHYKAAAIEPWDVVDTWPLEQRIGFYRGCALKYTMRLGSKAGSEEEEARKGEHLMMKLAEVLAERDQKGEKGDERAS